MPAARVVAVQGGVGRRLRPLWITPGCLFGQVDGCRQEAAVVPGGTAADDDQHRKRGVTEATHELLDTVDHHDGPVAIDLIERRRAQGRILPETPPEPTEE